MRQKIYATQQMAEELMKEAIAIWKQGNQAEHLEGIDKDPVVSLLMTALAYQEYIAEGELERLKAEVLDDFAQMLIPYELTHAVPASTIIQTSTEENVAEIELGSQNAFQIGGSGCSFIPLLKTKIFNASVKSIERLDARRWRVTLNFKEPVTSLGGLAFMVENERFKDLEVTLNGRRVELVKPWQYANLPLADCFSIDTQLYNTTLAFDAGATWFDLFAQHNKRMFVVERWQEEPLKQANDSLNLIFEFKGIGADFSFDKTKLLLNTTILVNVAQRSVRLSSEKPIAHIASNEQMLHLLRPSVDQIFGGNTPFIIRRAATQRFNVNGLLRLLHCIIDKYSTDYYAFMQVERARNGLDGARLYQWLKTLVKYVEEVPGAFTSGMYLMLKKTEGHEEDSLHINYLTTQGSVANSILDGGRITGVPTGLSLTDTRMMGEYLPGHDEVQGADAQHSLSRYFLITGNRLVTPADLKIFCYNEMLLRYNIASSQIKNITVRNNISCDPENCGFETEVLIMLVDDIFVQRSFADKIPQAEIVLQKMMEVRSASMYPIRLKIIIG
ncbi:MAG: hypothetical protein J6S05_00820 [Bacteroidaceae bacterium]|nr:hypothetical protein [Bacteroidaceae bacterium]